jgi:anti-sigma regulatory factor (Ser/Thr protein kinase)
MRKTLSEETRHELALRACRESIPQLIAFVCDYAREMAFEEKRIEQINLALTEALGNIVRFACPSGDEEIRISCAAHEMGALLVDIVDSGVPFNMLVLSTFPDVAAHSADPSDVPSTKIMKKVVKNVEYRRDGDSKTNILAWVVSR